MYNNFSKEIKSLDKDNILSNIWESVYKERMNKHGNDKKARISADSKVYSECLKIFMIKEQI